jgi:hypothetical protein
MYPNRAKCIVGSEFVGADEHRGKALSFFQDGVASHSTRSPNQSSQICQSRVTRKREENRWMERGTTPSWTYCWVLVHSGYSKVYFMVVCNNVGFLFTGFSCCHLPLDNDYDPNFIGLSRTKYGVQAYNEDFHDQYFYDFTTCLFFMMLTVCKAFQCVPSY